MESFQLTCKGNVIEYKILINNVLAGFINIEVHRDYKWFSMFCSKEDFFDLIKLNKYFYLNLLYINKEYRKKGLAKKLMKSFFDTQYQKLSKNYDCDQIVLYVESMENTVCNETLKKIYDEFGFKEISLPEIYLFNPLIAESYENNIMLY